MTVIRQVLCSSLNRIRKFTEFSCEEGSFVTLQELDDDSICFWGQSITARASWLTASR